MKKILIILVLSFFANIIFNTSNANAFAAYNAQYGTSYTAEKAAAALGN